MTTRILTPGCNHYNGHCAECGCEFSYQREDVHHNYRNSGEYVACPSCGASCHHFGASGTRWPRPLRDGGAKWSVS